MMMTADSVIEAIGKGVHCALEVSEFLLGAEASDFEHPRLEPEYLVTVEVAKALSRPDCVVAMEVLMSTLLNNARRKANLSLLAKGRKNVDGSNKRAEIGRVLKDFQYGTQRVDIAVFPSKEEPPLLIAEAKLGSQAPEAIIEDIKRVIRLLKMHYLLELGSNQYGAVFFYRMLKGGNQEGVRGRAGNLLKIINEHLSAEKAKDDQSWLKATAGLLSRHSFVEQVRAYEEMHPDGSSEWIFGRKKYAFAPGVILLGSTEDVENVKF